MLILIWRPRRTRGEKGVFPHQVAPGEDHREHRAAELSGDAERTGPERNLDPEDRALSEHHQAVAVVKCGGDVVVEATQRHNVRSLVDPYLTGRSQVSPQGVPVEQLVACGEPQREREMEQRNRIDEPLVKGHDYVSLFRVDVGEPGDFELEIEGRGCGACPGPFGGMKCTVKPDSTKERQQHRAAPDQHPRRQRHPRGLAPTLGLESESLLHRYTARVV
jgi:hypothetical protein